MPYKANIDNNSSLPYIIVMGASAGGLEAFKTIVTDLPADINAAIFIVWHMSPDIHGILPRVLGDLIPLPVVHAVNNEIIKAGHIYVAPPDHHLLVEDDVLKVTHGPKENRFRPAIDPLFRSAAYTYGNRVIGVILSGALDDGTAGMWRIKASMGTCIAQDPRDAEVASMPANAARVVEMDYCIPASGIGKLLGDLCKRTITVNDTAMRDEKTKIEIGIASGSNSLNRGSLDIGVLSPFTCPECHGVLSKITDGELTRFRCHTGHAYSIATLMESLNEKIEDNLYSALRGMDETILLLNHAGDHYAESNQPKLAAMYFTKAKQVLERSENIRTAVHLQRPVNNEDIIREAANEIHLEKD